MSSSSYSHQGGNKKNTRVDLPPFLKDIEELKIQFTADKFHTIYRENFNNELCFIKKDVKYAKTNVSLRTYLVGKAKELGLQFKIGDVEGDGNCFWYSLAELLGLTVSFL